jgi:hypothetical protein
MVLLMGEGGLLSVDGAASLGTGVGRHLLQIFTSGGCCLLKKGVLLFTQLWLVGLGVR